MNLTEYLEPKNVGELIEDIIEDNNTEIYKFYLTKVFFCCFNFISYI